MPLTISELLGCEPGDNCATMASPQAVVAPFIDSESTDVSVRTLRRNPPHHKANETADRLNLALSGGGEHVSHDSGVAKP